MIPDPKTFYPRDFQGYGADPPDPRWPGGAKLALSFVLNYEEGGENTVLNGDAGSELYLHEVPGGTPILGDRNRTVESQFEFGARAGVWRVLRAFAARGFPLTVYGVGRALELNPDVARAFAEAGHEIASHAWRWIDYHGMDEATERAEIAKCVETIERLTGTKPVGWYTGRISPNTRRLVMEHGGFLYDSDAYDDDLPHYVQGPKGPHLVIPYTLDANDMKYAVPPGFSSPDGWERYVTDAIEVLLAEGRAGAPKMMSVGLHCRIIGRPGRTAALQRVLARVAREPDIWVCRRADIARHWWTTHPPVA
ncbi:allantoinase PuuE [Roseomonas sp. HJA6]|uniref:Chitooligosaccharide deacetylase n=1 Tax=Roseomonas alba TaxID=2846776 RepID=A0ABS7AEA6_9PROT|nr:allantoinase PuuE [Neoroseomonas alba]MBW6400067.1 allantoinase PuuE [Neoroseomonas alba]